MNEKKLGLPSVIATSVGLIVATSCLLSLGQGSSAIGETFIISMIIACVLNILFALSVSEINSLMPDLTGGLAQYTLACMGPFITIIVMVGGYLVCNTMISSAECAMFGNTLNNVFPELGLSGSVYCVVLLVILIAVNLRGIDMFAKIQNVVAYGLITSLLIMGILGTIKINPANVVMQPAVLSSNFSDVTGLCGLAFFLFIGCEYAIPIANQVENPRKKLPLGMIISLVLICIMQIFMVIGFKNYTPWADLGESTTPHVLYGTALLGKFGTYWMALVSILAVVSSVNTIISSLAYIAYGMAKIGLLPGFFMKTNKKGAPWIGILIFGGVMLVINAFGLSTSGSLSFLILTGTVFWMAAYIVTHINVLILRKKLPKAPRVFKVPGGPVIPVIGSIGLLWMIWDIASDNATRMSIYSVCLIILAFLAVYAFVWVKKVMKKDLFKAYPVEEVMAMENELYPVYNDPKTGEPRVRPVASVK
jgi:amino acid transporter